MMHYKSLCLDRGGCVTQGLRMRSIYSLAKVPSQTLQGLQVSLCRFLFVFTGSHCAASHTAICSFTPSTTPSDYDILLPPQGENADPDRRPVLNQFINTKVL